DGNAANDAAGLRSGSVYVGATGARVGVNVGSRWGDTNVAAHDLFLQGSIVAGRGWAQLGFNDNGVEYEFGNTSNTLRNEWWGNAAGNVLGKNYIALLGGTEFGTGDTLGRGDKAFRGAGWGATGDITVKLSGRLDARGGTDYSYTQIGHGGSLAGNIGDNAGVEKKWDNAVGNAYNIDYVTRDGIAMNPGDWRRSFSSSTWRTNYAGDAARIDANIYVEADEDILIMGSRGWDFADELAPVIAGATYTMIGHGGSENAGSYHGDITVTAHGTTPAGFVRGPAGLGVQVIGGRGTKSFAMIGHGTDYEPNTRSVWDLTASGDIKVTATTGAIRLKAHTQLIRDGDINVGRIIEDDEVTPLSNASDNDRLGSFVQIGHGGARNGAAAAGGKFQMKDGTAIANIQPDQSATGDITVIAGGTFIDPEDPGSRVGIKVEAGNGANSHGMIGHGGRALNAVRTTPVAVDFGASAAMGGFNRTPTLRASVGFRGNIRVEAPYGDIVFTGGEAFRPERAWGYGRNFVQIGHGGNAVNGPKGGKITVLAGQGDGATDGDILFQAGRMYEEHAMIGHGGYNSGSSNLSGWTSNKDLDPADRDLSRGGIVVAGDNTAEIVVKAYGSVSFISPEGGPTDGLFLSHDWAYWWYNNASSAATNTTNNTGNNGWNTTSRFVQLGHGGRSSVTVMPDRQDITVISGTGDMANADGDENTGGVYFVAGDREYDYAQLGHGGFQSGANDAAGFVGDITVTANGGGVRFDASILGGRTTEVRTDVSINGINFNIPQNPYADPDRVVIAQGGGEYAYAQLGHGGHETRGVHSGHITINAWGGIEFLSAEAAPGTARHVTSAPINEAFTAGANVWIAFANLVDTVGVGTPANGAGRVYKMPELTSNDIIPGTVRIVLSDGSVVTDRAANGSDDRNGKLILNGTTEIGDINYEKGLIKFNVSYATAVPGGPGLTTQAVADYENGQGNKIANYVQLGHGGYDADGPNNKANNLPGNSGNITINAGGDITFKAGANYRAYAQLGHGGLDVKGAHSGDITINHVDANHLVGGLWFSAGHGSYRHFDYQAYMQVGHGGYAASGNHYGNITIVGTEDEDGVGLLLKAGDREGNYAQIGHGGYASTSGGTGGVFYGLNGNIDIEVSGDIAVVAGTMKRSNNPAFYQDGLLTAKIGHGGQSGRASSDDVDYRTNANNVGANATLANAGTAGAGDGNWGHFGDIRVVSTGGNISLMAGNTVPLASRTDIYGGTPLAGVDDPLGLLVSWGDGWGRRHTAEIGHGGIFSRGNHFGNITVSAGGGVNIAGGENSVMAPTSTSTTYSYAQIGHGVMEGNGNAGRD
ncbi:MAG TPA: hypothetical protein PLA50_08795, partial [Bacteroidia bacterium]|nr:hypothetical protein [Bacteroidia bacterium]